MTDVKHRVTAKIGGKSYDLRPSGNPHSKLPKEVIAYLKEGGHLADVAAAPVSGNGSDVARMQAEIDKLTTQVKSLQAELATATEDLGKSEAELDAAKAEIDKLKKPAQ